MDNIVNHTHQFFKAMDENLTRLESQGFCGCGSKNFMGELERQKAHLFEINYFWYNLSMLDPREGYQEIHHCPEFEEKKLRQAIVSYLEKHLPQEQEPITLVKKEKIQVPIKIL